MYSIGEIVDRLIIENIKLFNIRERLNKLEPSQEEEAVKLNEQMTTLNRNRNKLIELLDDKIDRVCSGEEKNVILEKVRTV